MLRYIIRRFLTAIPTLLVVAVLIFVLIRCIPGNPAQVMLSEDATNEEVAAMERKLGLDQPIFVQFIKWISNAIRGDFGKSLYYNEPVLGILAARLGPTMLLVLYAMLIATTLGVGLGILDRLESCDFLLSQKSDFPFCRLCYSCRRWTQPSAVLSDAPCCSTGAAALCEHCARYAFQHAGCSWK